MVRFLSGRKTVTAAGTAEPLVTTSTRALSVLITAKPDNDDYVCVGGSDVVASLSTCKGVLLAACQHVAISAGYGSGFGAERGNLDLADIYVDAVTNGDGVTFLAILP